jgi:rhodanese-related sulfurtransferase
VVVIDVRPAPEYAAGHLAGATSVPPDELASLLPALPADRDIVAYCRGPFCAYADQAVLHLQALGRTAYRLDVGYLDWSAGD